MIDATKKARRRELKKLAKAELARQSAEFNAAMKAANPHDTDDPAWITSYRKSTRREKWLDRKLPLLHKRELNTLFSVLPYRSEGWVPHVGGYVLCTKCGSASPSMIPKRLLYWTSCECGNIKWRCIGPWCTLVVDHPDLLIPVKLIGKG